MNISSYTYILYIIIYINTGIATYHYILFNHSECKSDYGMYYFRRDTLQRHQELQCKKCPVETSSTFLQQCLFGWYVTLDYLRHINFNVTASKSGSKSSLTSCGFSSLATICSSFSDSRVGAVRVGAREASPATSKDNKRVRPKVVILTKEASCHSMMVVK